MYKILIVISVISLYMSFTNMVPASALICAFFFVVPFIIYMKEKVNKVVFWAILLLLYFGLSTIVYNPQSLLEYEFYRHDGNVYISMMPLIVLGAISCHISVNKILHGFLYVTTGINIVFMLCFIITGESFVGIEDGVYHLLFKAHNAAGGFLMMLSALCFGVYWVNRKKVFLLLLIVNSCGLYLTDSRGSLLGFVVGVFSLYILKVNKIKYMVALIVGIQMVLYTSSYYFAPENFMDVNLMTVDDVQIDETMERGGTFINRFFYLWPRAIYLFLQSPILGTGFGSYNDMQYNLIGMCGFYINDSMIIYNDGHAHNSYLHFMAETGLLGIIIFICFIRQVYSFLINSFGIDEELGYGLFVCFWAALVSAVTEHRMTAPAQMLPFYILLGLFVAEKTNKQQKKALQ